MGLFRNLFRKAQELDFQDRRIVLLEGEVRHLQNKLMLTEKAWKDERAKKDKVLLRHADMMSQKAGLVPAFVKDAEPPAKEEPDHETEGRIAEIARMQKEADDAEGLAPRPLDYYRELVREEGAESLILN